MKIAETLSNLLEEFKIDAAKAETGNDSAATRARKTLQQMIRSCREGRVEIQAARKKKS